jgi:hypothetical protein
MKFKDIFVIEARKPKPTPKSKTQTVDQDDPFLRTFGNIGTAGAGDQAPAVRPRQQDQQPKPKSKPTPRIRQATAAQTRAKTAGIEMPADAEKYFRSINDLNLDDQMPDEEVRRHAGITQGQDPEPKTPSTALARISTEIARAGEVYPEWHQVRHLPGYFQRAIRSLGRQVFGSITTTPIEEIQVLASLGDSGPNTSREINAVTDWLRKNGVRDRDGEIDFQQSIPGYDAEFFIYRTQNMTFMLVKDFAGNYIYNWPSSDEKRLEGPESQIDQKLPRRLR